MKWGFDLLGYGRWPEIGCPVHKKNVDRDREERKEGEEGCAL